MKSLEEGVWPPVAKTNFPTFDVVVLDDHPMERAYAVQVLTKRKDLHVVGFEAPRSMFSALGRRLSGLKYLLLDLQMPEMDGFQVIRHLAEDGFAGRLIVISAHESQILDAAVQLARSLGLVNTMSLHKPYVPEQLLTLLTGSEAVHVGALESRASHPPLNVMRGIDQGQFCLHYQPKVSCHTGSCVGFEALSRWRHPAFGFVQPSHFIAAVEARGQMDRLTRHVMTLALKQAKRWLLQGRQLSINVSMDNLTDVHFPDWVINQLDLHGIPPYQLCLEVTETKIMSNPVVTLEVLGRLGLLGVDISIDDFGTGYSSLKQLLDLPIQELKVDRSFVTGVHKDKAKQSILATSIEMAKQLGLRTVVEGVEDMAEYCCVRHLGADVVQGYLLSRPLDAEAMDGWLLCWAARPAWPGNQAAIIPGVNAYHQTIGVAC